MFVFERLLQPLTTMRRVRSVSLVERDGFLIYRSSADNSNDEGQRRKWPEMIAQSRGETVTLVFEGGTVVACQTKAGCLVVHAASNVNLGMLFSQVDAVKDSIRGTKSGHGGP